MIFTYNGSDVAETNSKWKEAVSTPTGELAQIVDSTFPAKFDLKMCSKVKEATDETKDTKYDIFAGGSEAHAAYLLACEWMVHKLKVFASVLNSTQNQPDGQG